MDLSITDIVIFWGIFKPSIMLYDRNGTSLDVLILKYGDKTMKLRLLTLLLLGTLLTGCAQNTEAVHENESAEATQTTSETAEQEKEPYVLTFEANTIEGETLTSEILSQSKLTMINVWATYCNPCLSEMPDLGAIAASYDTEDFQLLGIISDVSEEASEDDMNNAKELIEQTGADYSHLLLNQSLYSNLVGAVSAVPTTFFVNQKGEMLGYVEGARSQEAWEEIINELLAEME